MRDSDRQYFILNKKKAFEVKTKSDLNDFNKLKTITLNLKIKENYLISQSFTQDSFSFPITML